MALTYEDKVKENYDDKSDMANLLIESDIDECKRKIKHSCKKVKIFDLLELVEIAEAIRAIQCD